MGNKSPILRIWGKALGKFKICASRGTRLGSRAPTEACLRPSWNLLGASWEPLGAKNSKCRFMLPLLSPS
eukprot:7449604-Pyramimonas_sp.AAC.1